MVCILDICFFGFFVKVIGKAISVRWMRCVD